MRRYAFARGMCLLKASFGTPIDAQGALELTVSPRFSSAPATLRIRATTSPDAATRAVMNVADSHTFFRASEVPIAGENAPRTVTVEDKNLPAGTYAIHSVLVGAAGKQLAAADAEVICLGSVAIDAFGDRSSGRRLGSNHAGSPHRGEQPV